MPEALTRMDIKIYVGIGFFVISLLTAAGFNLKLASAEKVENNSSSIVRNTVSLRSHKDRYLLLKEDLYSMKERQAITENTVNFIKDDINAINKSQSEILKLLGRLIPPQP